MAYYVRVLWKTKANKKSIHFRSYVSHIFLSIPDHISPYGKLYFLPSLDFLEEMR
jgi:hypothetical protein